MPCPPEKPPEAMPCPPIAPESIPQQNAKAKNIQDAALGCFLGAVVGDAAGTVLEFIRRQPHPKRG